MTAGLSACSGGDKQGPKLADVSGTWNATWSNMSGGGHSCSLTLTLTLTQQGSALTGSYGNAMVGCDGQNAGPVSGIVANGTVNGDQVSFDLDSQALHQTGTVSAASMYGNATWTLSDGTTTIRLTGNWAATHP
ncbi:MAG TPA: hypothetical protein VJN39_07495 [Gemmatimonadales bacterium]|nr:hypothetical protein [Gemmatimonadales bacterium]